MRKVIDSHAHFGEFMPWKFTAETLVGLMDKNGIDIAVAGDLSGNISGAFSAGQALRKTQDLRDRLRLMLWVNPAVNDSEAARRLLETERDRFACVKVHPQTSRQPLDSGRYEPYIALCREFGLPFAAHTERDSFCDIDRLAQMADDHPDVPFIAVHMELKSDHTRAIEMIRDHANLYGDTTFVPAYDVLRAVGTCGAGKILFGSDAPIMPERSYGQMEELYQAITDRFGSGAAERVFRENCRALMGIG